MFTDNINLRKFTIVICLVSILTTLAVSVPSYANDDTFDNIESDIDKQNEQLYDKIMRYKTDGVNDLDSMFKESDRMNKEGGTAGFDLSKISSALQINSVKLALWARKYIVPFTILIILFNVFLLATSAKNYKNRKKYILGSVFFYVVFLIVLNFPIYLLWRYSLGPGTPFSFDGFYGFVEGITIFLKEQSFVFSIIVISYGIVNYIGSQNNLPRRLSSQFIMKTSVAMFVIFQILPLVLKLAV